ncbi:MAG: NAD(P)H-hydrate epimerase, partial [Pyrinomonadaceae bacterium]
MRKILSATQMREIDRLTTERYGIPSLLLMEAAGGAAARSIYEHFNGELKQKTILILCGHGNNGGDGAALGRALWSMGATVTVILLGQVRETRGDALANFGIVDSIDESGVDENGAILRFEECISFDQIEFILASMVDYDVIVDALLGTGLTRPLEGLFLDVVDRLMNVCDALERTHARRPLLVSLDLPSGLNADETETDDVCINADMTITFTAPKIANVLPPASRKNGRLIVADIGSPAPLLKQTASNLFLAEESDARSWLEATRYRPGSYKKSHGSVLIIAGSSNYTGAAVLCGNAAMRAGAGLVRVASPAASIESIKARLIPE